MSKSKILFVNQEIAPYLPETYLSQHCRQLCQGMQEFGNEVRTFMPRFGLINERRNQLHEVQRLSGMNIVINDTDHPLIIKVATLQNARMQVYFIDNEDYFGKKHLFHDKITDKFLEDNDERAIFFTRGVIETIKRLSWAPDVIHCHGWFSSLTPIYVKHMYKNHPLFANSKIITSLYGDSFKGSFNKKFPSKLKADEVGGRELGKYDKFSCENLMKMAISLSDGIVLGDEVENINPELISYAKRARKPILPYQGSENYVDAFDNFYDKIILS